MTFDPNDLDLFKGNFGVKLHPPNKLHPNWTQDLKKKNLTFVLNDLDLNVHLKGNSGVSLHSPSKFGEGRQKDAGEVGK